MTLSSGGARMVAVLLAVLGVPLWLLAGMMLGAWYTRRRYRQTPGVFRCHCRVVDGDVDGLDDAWSRAPVHGRWVHDVLLLSRGVALVRFVAIPISAVVTAPETRDDVAVRGLEGPPLLLTLRTDDGATIEVAAAAADRSTLAGPFSPPPEDPPADG